MVKENEFKKNGPYTLKISLDERSDFKGNIAAFLFDREIVGKRWEGIFFPRRANRFPCPIVYRPGCQYGR